VHGKIADTLNDIIDMADRTSSDFERVSQVVGKAGKVSARLTVADLHGSWASLVDSSNTLIEDLVSPLNEVVRVINAVSTGDLSHKIMVDVRGEFLQLKETINTMVDQLRSFASEVTREVGMEGRLGGQAYVTGVSGTWKDLTVNGLAANLTSQVRAIAGVATAVTKGDLTRSVMVEAKGEVAELKDSMPALIR
jgi:HAMP domain-containing protein